MVNLNKLRGAIARAGHTQTSLYPLMNMCQNTLNAKVNGGSPITCDEADLFCEVLGIKDYNEMVEIFLA